MKKTMSIYLLIGAFILVGCSILLNRIKKTGISEENVAEGMVLYIGTYGESLYRYIYDQTDDTFTPLERGRINNPSFVALGTENIKDGIYDVYAVSESGDSSSVVSFADNIRMSRTGECREIGADPCHLIFDFLSNTVMTADYSGGSVSVFGVRDNGSVGNLLERIRFDGSGPVAGRQESSHIHQLTFMPVYKDAYGRDSVRYLLATDLGADKIRVLKVVPGKDRWCSLLHCPEYDLHLAEGCGPRHIAFSSDGSFMYCLTELSGELLVYSVSYDSVGRPLFEHKQTVLADEKRAGGSADIHIHPSGKFIYTSHRLENDGISIFSVASDGKVCKTGYCNTGKHPRNFVITPDGSKVLVACRDSRKVEVYEVDSKDGSLESAGSGLMLENDSPSCLVIAE